MKILMIGNGFDLEHELPTKYTHLSQDLNMHIHRQIVYPKGYMI